MAEDIITTNDKPISVVGPEFLCGRLDILSSVEALTADNVVNEVNEALACHNKNLISEDYLYWYRRGLQPILNRTKDRNTFVLTKCIENHAQEVVSFWNGFILQENTKFVSRRNGVQRKVDKLNEYVFRSGKPEADSSIVDWFLTVGKGVLYVEESADAEIPINCYSLDPRSAFVVYSMRPGNKPLYAVNYVANGDTALVDVYTKDTIFRLRGSYSGQKTTQFQEHQTTAVQLVGVETNVLGHIPIIEYRYNSVNFASFEGIIYLLDCINQVQSGRLDAIEQFVQSVIVAVNCTFEEGTTADDIKKQGMIILSSIGENKADFKILSEELNQEQTQKLVDNLYESAMRIACVPVNTKGVGDARTGNAVIFRQGWENAISSARSTVEQWKKSDAYFQDIVVDVLTRRGLIKNLKRTDFDLNFVIEEMANIQSKAQAFQTLLSAGLHPELAAKKSGISSDPVSDIKMSEKYLRMVWGDPDKVDETEEATDGQGEAEIVESDNYTGENAVV